MLGPSIRIGRRTNLNTTTHTTTNTTIRARVRSGRRPKTIACHHGAWLTDLPASMQLLRRPALSVGTFNPLIQLRQIRDFHPRAIPFHFFAEAGMLGEVSEQR